MAKRNISPYLRKSGEELQQFLQFQRRGSSVKSKKGKGSYTRNPKHRGKDWN